MTTATLSRGNSDTAQYLDNVNQEKEQYFRQSVFFSKQPVYEELITVWEECRVANWNGDDALPVREETLINTYFFIEALPLRYPLPSVGAEPDGHLTLEWYQSTRWTLSLSISPEGILYYAALFGNSDVRGSEIFFGEVPESILDLIQRVRIA